MSIAIRVVAGLLLVAHGLVHVLYLTPDPDDPKYPFTLRSSWILPEHTRRPVAVALVSGTVLAFMLLALAIWRVPGLAGIWPGLTMVAAGLSLAMLVAFWDTRLIAGVAIDVALIALAVVRPEWTQP